MRHPTRVITAIVFLLSLILLATACTPATPLPTLTPTVTGTSVPTSTPTPAPEKIFAPYMDVGIGIYSPLLKLANNGSGNKHYTLAFVLGQGCTAAWFGAYKMDSSTANVIGSRINELRNAGGDVIVSFGGAGGPELANTCPNSETLQEQYQAVVSKYNLKAIDLDIEEFTPSAIENRNQALKALEAANPELKVQYTLGVNESGFTQNQLNILNSAKSNGTRVDRVNIMTMDYGHAVADMSAAAISAAKAARKQLDGLGFTSTQLGITPMIGVNDSAEETFTLENATALTAWASENGITELSFWAMPRDNGKCPDRPTAAANCSGIAQAAFQFSSIFQAFAP